MSLAPKNRPLPYFFDRIDLLSGYGCRIRRKQPGGPSFARAKKIQHHFRIQRNQLLPGAFFLDGLALPLGMIFQELCRLTEPPPQPVAVRRPPGARHSSKSSGAGGTFVW